MVQYKDIPTEEEFQLEIENHVKNLTAARKGKAIVTMDLYQDIVMVLNEPENTKLKDAQFRHWVKTHFRMGQQGRLLRDEKVVLMDFEIYNIIAQVHIELGHGGRDRTCKVLKEQYACVPKCLVEGFLRLCPKCKDRNAKTSNKSDSSKPSLSPSPAPSSATEPSSSTSTSQHTSSP